MPLFLTEFERTELNRFRKHDPAAQSLYWALLNRADQRAAFPGITGGGATTEWWHHASEYLTDAAMAFALKPTALLARWIQDATLSVVRRPVKDWVGPPFRAYSEHDPVGHLETAHLSWAVAIVLDLAPDAFSEPERAEIAWALREKGITLCQRWLDRNDHLANWRCVLNAGTSVAAAVLNDQEQLQQSEQEFRLCQEIFQRDGSYSESLQYGNYAAYTQMLTWEALTRRQPALAETLPLEPYALMPRWQAASYFYQKPLSGWGAHPIARSANFNDSAAIFRPSADVLLHLAARGKHRHPQEAGLARWLFESTYLPEVGQGPHDRSSFGFVNDYGFLSMPLLAASAAPVSPEEAGLPLTAAFSCGDVIARDAWGGRTILAARGGGDALCGPGHLHGDLNSFILVHNRERLLVDPGHSCYRNLIHDLEGSSLTHNTCTFSIERDEGLELQEDLLKTRYLQQSRSARRRLDPKNGKPLPPVDRGGRRLLAARDGRVTAIASDAAALYGNPITEFTRFWFLCGTHAVFVVDRIRATRPVKTTWNWLINNRDGQLKLKLLPPDRLVARRGNAGMKLFHLGVGGMAHPIHAYVHDAYHPLPNQLGEGASGSGSLVRWTERTASAERTVAHAISLDDPGSIAAWHLRKENGAMVLEGPESREIWRLEIAADGMRFLITDGTAGKSHAITVGDGGLELAPVSSP